MLIMAACSILIGLLLTINGTYLHIFLSADKVTAETLRFGNSYLYIDLSLYAFLGFIFVARNCVQGIGKPQFVLGAERPSLSRALPSVCCCLRRSRAAWSARRHRRRRSTACAWLTRLRGCQPTRCCAFRLSRTSCAKTTTIFTAAARNSLSDKRTINLPPPYSKYGGASVVHNETEKFVVSRCSSDRHIDR